MSNSSQQGGDKVVGLVIGMIILGLAFLYLKKSGQVDSIKAAVHTLDGGSSSRGED